MTPSEAKELIQRSRSASTENEATEVEALVKLFEDHVSSRFCLKQVVGPDEMPPKTFSEFLANLHEVVSGRRLFEAITEELVSRLPCYGTGLSTKQAINLVEPVYQAVRDEWLNRHVLA